MNIWITIIGIVLLLVILIFLTLRIIKKRKKNMSYIPQDVLGQLEEAEKRLAESKGRKTAQEVMLDMMNERKEIETLPQLPPQQQTQIKKVNPFKRFVKRQ